jgi:hypothetical protein
MLKVKSGRYPGNNGCNGLYRICVCPGHCGGYVALSPGSRQGEVRVARRESGRADVPPPSPPLRGACHTAADGSFLTQADIDSYSHAEPHALFNPADAVTPRPPCRPRAVLLKAWYGTHCGQSDGGNTMSPTRLPVSQYTVRRVEVPHRVEAIGKSLSSHEVQRIRVPRWRLEGVLACPPKRSDGGVRGMAVRRRRSSSACPLT